MGEGVTNPTDSAVEGSPVLSAACLKLVLLFGLSCAVALQWRRRRLRQEAEISDAPAKENKTSGENPSTSLTGHSGPHLRRPARCGTLSQLQQSVTDNMEQNTDIPPDPQPDSFFTWDSGGNSGDYSFVHTAVELPKYPDGSITEEERQMLLLYMQTGHPELLLNTTNASMDSAHSLLGPPPVSDALMCDQATVRGFLETIVEENSDDLKSPSDCDEASVGWGSWDESDDDRVTVVEMETNDQNEIQNANSDIKHGTRDLCAVYDIGETGNNTSITAYGYIFTDNLGMKNTNGETENHLGDWNLSGQQSTTLSCATSVHNSASENRGVVCSNVTNNKSAELNKVCSVSSVVNQNVDVLMDTKSKVSLSSKINSDFESLWISTDKIDNSAVETFNPWCNNEVKFIPEPSDIHKLNFNDHSEISNENSLLELSTDDLCLVPSGVSESVVHDAEKHMFSDDFKDYFLPAGDFVPEFNTKENGVIDVFASENSNESAKTKMRCFRLGFETEPTEIVKDVNYFCSSDENSTSLNAENENSINCDLQEETLFSPRDGDVVYGSSWLSGPVMKKPEKSSSSAEARFSTMLSESPPVDNIRKALHLSDHSASDDEMQPVSNSLSRWQHHTDLQHVQEATSPLTRWQHKSDLHKLPDMDRFSKQAESDEDTDDGLPPQLKEIYSSFKMKDKKMGRIRIKEDKNNNFKKIGLWDNETKVTLPPFISTSTLIDYSQTVSNGTVKEEDLDDLELDMFSVSSNNSALKPDISSNNDIDDALKGFKHLDDYSSTSEENSESENSYTVNTVTNIDYENEDLSEPSTPDMPSLQNDIFNSPVDEHLKSENENTCSDNSDNCPLCIDPSFKHSKINDIFADPAEKIILDNNVKSLLLNTFPKITQLATADNSVESNGIASSLTSSDSDEGIRTAKDIKKRIKKRLKDNSIAELKHDDSGYVEDDEDDDDDSLEDKEIKDPLQILTSAPSNQDHSSKIRKSLSSAFYESKSVTDTTATHTELIPKSFEEFSNQLEKSVLAKDGVIANEKWNIPENLSQFSAWLLDKELRKINSRDEMEKLIVNDIMSLREQTIAKFLKNSITDEKSAFSRLDESEITYNKDISPSVSIDLHSKTSNCVETETSPALNHVEKTVKINIIEVIQSELNLDSKEIISGKVLDKIEGTCKNIDSAYVNSKASQSVSNLLDFCSEKCEKMSDRSEEYSESFSQNDIEENIPSYENEYLAGDEMLQNKTESTDATYQHKISTGDKPSNDIFATQSPNPEPDVDKKQEYDTKRQRDVNEAELENRVKVNCTITSVTSHEKPEIRNKNVEVESAEGFFTINTFTPEKEEILCEVSPSIENILNYDTSNEKEDKLNYKVISKEDKIAGDTPLFIEDALNDKLVKDNNKSISRDFISSEESHAACDVLSFIDNLSYEESEKLNYDITVELHKNDRDVPLINENILNYKVSNDTIILNNIRSIEVDKTSSDLSPSAKNISNTDETDLEKKFHEIVEADISSTTYAWEANNDIKINLSHLGTWDSGPKSHDVVDKTEFCIDSVKFNAEIDSNNGFDGSDNITQINNQLQNEINYAQVPVDNYVVLPSSDPEINEDFNAVENEVDLKVSDAKAAHRSFADDIISLEAKAASKAVGSKEHVTCVDYHAYEELGSAGLCLVNGNVETVLPTQCVVNDTLSAFVIAKTGIEEVQKPDDTVSLCVKGESSELSDTGPVHLSIAKNISEEDITSKILQGVESGASEKLNSDNISASEPQVTRRNSRLNNLYKCKSITVLQIDDDFEDESDEENTSALINSTTSIHVFNDKAYLSKSTGGLNCEITGDDTITTHIQSSDDLCLEATKEKRRGAREEYQRSRSVGRENQEETETFETWCGQSKSTPDLSRCHDLQLSSSVPLSALLSKSVSQRIQDYLGKSNRGNTLSRSLPPNERSRHYRRICVSTETVVERAARFEARSQSGTRKEKEIDLGSSRSDSCPPGSNMKTIDTTRSLNVRNYSKPTATVRPTFDTCKGYDDKIIKKNEDDLLELITGYNKASKVTHKPPVPPSTTPQQSLKSFRLKGKIASARKEFFERLSQQDVRPSKSDTTKTSPDVDLDDDTCGLRRFSEFRKSAREERARLAQSHPDLGALEAAVRSSRRRIDQLKKRRQKTAPLDAGLRPDANTMPGTTTQTKDGTLVLPYRRCTGEIAWASCSKRLQEERARSAGSRIREPFEIVDERQFKRPAERSPVRAHGGYGHAADDDEEAEYGPGPASSIPGSDFSRARSMDFLLDNRERAEPPENQLAQRVKSEHELRVERSLQNLTLPDWYTQSKKPKEGFILRRGSEGSAGESRKRWLGFSSSRTPSATSLTTPPSSYSQRSIVIPKRVTPTSGEWRCIGSLVSSRESLLTPASPASLSPRDCSSSAAFNYGLNASLSRWSSSRLSTSSAPLTSLSVHRSFRQPYLGWRAAASSSGGASRSSPGVSPINATTPLQGSRPGSPRRGSQDQQYGYGLQQNQVTSAATLRPEGNETGDSGSRISPLALYDNTTNVFFNSNIEVPASYSTPELRRDRYSYTQSLYSGTVIVSPGTEFKPVPSIAENNTSSTTDDRFSMSKSPQPPPRIWMESSFVGSRKDDQDAVAYPQGRTIRIVPSDSVRSGDSSKGGGSSMRSTCAPQTTMGEYVLRDFRRFGITL